MPDKPTHPAILASEGLSPPPDERGISSASVKPAKASGAKKPRKARKAKKK